MAGYVTPKVYGGYTYTRGDALVVKGNYYTAVNNSSASGSFSSNTTKYFYGYYTPDSGTVLNPLALMNSSSQNSVTFGFMRMDAIQSGGTANTYTITINMNGGTANGVSSMTPTYGTNGWYTFGANIPTRSGYRFKGLYTAASGGTQVYNSSGVAVNGSYWSVSGNTYKWIYTDNVTLYAQWVAVYYLNLNVYLNDSSINNTNIFHCDVTVGGTTQASNVCDYYKQHDTGSSWSVTGLTTASGYTRYATSATSGTLTAKTNCNVYIGQNYTITYDKNGGTSGNSTQIVNYGTAWTTKGATCVKSGYTQTSWNTAANGTGTKYSLSTAQTNKQSSNLTLYAIYTGNTYYVRYNANGGSGSMSNSTHQYGTSSKLTANAFTKTGYTFTGWNTKADGTGTALVNQHTLNGLTATAGATVDIYAQWSPKTCLATFYRNYNSSDTTTTAVTYTYDVANQAFAAHWTRTGYTFLGWSATRTATSATWTPTNEVSNSWIDSNSSGISIYAIWKPNNYTITYDANGGYNANQTQSVTYDSSFNFKGALFAKPHYVQTKWNTEKDGSGTNYTHGASATYTIVGDLTVYAQYRPLTKAEKDIYLYSDGSVEAVAYAKTSDIYGFAGGVVCAKDFTIGTPASSPSKTMQFTAMRIKNLS